MSFGKNRKLFALWVSDYFKDYVKFGVKTVIVKTVFSSVFNYRLKTRSLPIFNYYNATRLGNIKKK
jgi:hypothetical protein